MKFENEKKQFACMIAYYVGTISPTLDYLRVMTNCIDKANDYEFPVLEENGETLINTSDALDDAYEIAIEIVDDWEGGWKGETI